MRPKKSLAIISLGCPRNLVDSEMIIGRLNLNGYRVVDKIEDADIGVVNTCAFINDAKKESIDVLLDLIELKNSGKLKKIIVYGCLVQRYKDKLIKELPEIDAFIGKVSLNHSKCRFPLTAPHFAYLKICEGCINNCSYCVIPKIKGAFTSLREELLLEKARGLDGEGISELNIIGQDITGYGLDIYGKESLPRLLRGILKNTSNIHWFRLLYLHPERLSDELLEVIRDQERLCKYIDLPLQHINDRILKLMNRNLKKADIIKLIEKVRKVIPGVTLRSAFIVGFPTETEAEFKELLKFIEDMRFERLGAFIYSREESTAAYNLKDQVPVKTKNERLSLLMEKQQDISRKINSRYLGRVLEVLIDEKDKDHYLGRTQHDAPEVDGLVYVRSSLDLKPGDFVKVKICDTLEYDLVGEPVN